MIIIKSHLSIHDMTIRLSDNPTNTYLPILENTHTINPTTTTTSRIPTATPTLKMPSINSQLCKESANAAIKASDILLKFSMSSFF